jgi:hypothetical protein
VALGSWNAGECGGVALGSWNASGLGFRGGHHSTPIGWGWPSHPFPFFVFFFKKKIIINLFIYFLINLYFFI